MKQQKKNSMIKSVQVKNKKIIAWLLNRNKESMKEEREEFFKQINESI